MYIYIKSLYINIFIYVYIYKCRYMSILLFYISRPAGSNFIYPMEDEEPPPLVDSDSEAVVEDDAEGEPVEEKEAPSALVVEPSEENEAPPALVVEPSEEKEAPPALVAEPAEDGAEAVWEGHTHEDIDRAFAENRRYISNMVSRWAGSDYESSPDEDAHCSSGCMRWH
jgi:hypothetical protein